MTTNNTQAAGQTPLKDIAGNDEATSREVYADFENAAEAIRNGAQFYLVVIDAKAGEPLTGQTTVRSIGFLETNGAWNTVHATLHHVMNNSQMQDPDAEELVPEYNGLTLSDM